MDSILNGIFLTGFTGLSGCFFAGFPDENLQFQSPAAIGLGSHINGKCKFGVPEIS